MQLYYGAQIYSKDQEPLGVLDELIIDPRSRVVTHMVVRQGLFFNSDRGIPVEWVSEATEHRIYLSCSVEELDESSLPEYQDSQYVGYQDQEASRAHGTGGKIWLRPSGVGPESVPYPSVVPPGIGPLPPEPQTPLPVNEIGLERKSSVCSAEGNDVGTVTELITDENENITHILISEGRIFSEAKELPVDWIHSIENNVIYLAVTDEVLDQL